MEKKWLWLVALVLGLLFLLGFGGVLWVIPKFEVVNNLPLKQFRLSTLAGTAYLWKVGYWPEINRVKVIYTSEPQKGYILRNGADGQVTQSLWMERQGRVVTVYIQYTPEKYPDIAGRKDWFEADVFASICLAMEGKSLGYDGCYQKAREYMEWASGNKIGRIVSDKGTDWRRKFSLVKQAYAQLCTGTIQCGAEDWKCGPCSNGEDCNSGDTCSVDNKPCPCGNVCDLFLGNDLNCSTVTTQDLCLAATAYNCAVGCNESLDNPCSWGGVSGPTPTPGGGSCAGSAPACNGSCPAPQNCINNGEGGCKCVPPPEVPDNLADIRVRMDTNTNGSIDDSDPYVYNSDSGFAGSCGYAATGADIQSIMAYQDQVDYLQDPDGANQFDGYNRYCLPDSGGKPTSRFNSEGAFWYYITVPKGYKMVGGRSVENKPGAQYQDNCLNDAVKKNIPEGGETWMIYCADMEAWENAEIEFLIQAECQSFSDIYVKECNRNSDNTIKYYDVPRPEACKTTDGTEAVTNLMSGMPKVRYKEVDSGLSCTSADFSGISWESRTSTKNQTFSAGVGDKKICAEFTDRNLKVSVKCGGMIYRDVTPSPTEEPPILTPTPYVQGYLRNQAGGAVTAESFRRFCGWYYDKQVLNTSDYLSEISSCDAEATEVGVAVVFHRLLLHVIPDIS